MMVKSIRYHHIFLILFFSFNAYLSTGVCQQNGDLISSILSKSVSTTDSFLLNSFQSDIEAINYRLPLMEKLEVRTETDRMMLGRQEFMVRSSFNNFKLRDAISDERKAFLNWKYNENQTATRDKLLETYMQILRGVKIKNKQRLHSEFIKHISEQIKLNEKMLTAGEAVDLVDYLSLKKNLLQFTAEADEYESELSMIYKTLGLQGKESEVFDILKIEDAETTVSFLDWNTERHFKNTENSARLDYLEATYEREKAKSSKILDFIQTKYTVREDLLLENRFSLGLGLLIPWKGSSKIELNDIITKKKEAEYENTLYFSNLNQKISNLHSLFKNKVSLYRQIKAINTDDKSVLLKKAITESATVNPLKLFNIKMEELELEEKTDEIEEEIFSIYIQLLHTSGILYLRPYRNYLLPSAPEIFNK